MNINFKTHGSDKIHDFFKNIKKVQEKMNTDDFIKKAMKMKEQIKNQHAKDAARGYGFEARIPHIHVEGSPNDMGPINDVNGLNYLLQSRYKESNYEIEEGENQIFVFIYIHDDDKLYSILEELQVRNQTVTTDVRIIRRLN